MVVNFKLKSHGNGNQVEMTVDNSKGMFNMIMTGQTPGQSYEIAVNTFEELKMFVLGLAHNKAREFGYNIIFEPLSDGEKKEMEQSLKKPDYVLL